MRGQGITHGCAHGARAATMDDAYKGQACACGGVEIALEAVEPLVHAHATQVQFHTGAFGGDVACLKCNARRHILTRGLLAQFKALDGQTQPETAQLHVGLTLAFVDGEDVASGLQAGHKDAVAHLDRTRNALFRAAGHDDTPLNLALLAAAAIQFLLRAVEEFIMRGRAHAAGSTRAKGRRAQVTAHLVELGA